MVFDKDATGSGWNRREPMGTDGNRRERLQLIDASRMRAKRERERKRERKRKRERNERIPLFPRLSYELWCWFGMDCSIPQKLAFCFDMSRFYGNERSINKASINLPVYITAPQQLWMYCIHRRRLMNGPFSTVLIRIPTWYHKQNHLLVPMQWWRSFTNCRLGCFPWHTIRYSSIRSGAGNGRFFIVDYCCQKSWQAIQSLGLTLHLQKQNLGRLPLEIPRCVKIIWVKLMMMMMMTLLLLFILRTCLITNKQKKKTKKI